MIKSRLVQFQEIAQELSDKVKASSNEVEIQDYSREVDLKYTQVAYYHLCSYPKEGM